jgi:hypothetical protein
MESIVAAFRLFLVLFLYDILLDPEDGGTVFLKTSVNFHPTIRRHVSDDITSNRYLSKNLRTRKVVYGQLCI